MRSTLSSLVLITCFGLLFGEAVVQAAEPDSAERVEFFETHVRPVLIARCYSCHSAAEDSREGGLALDSRAGWATGGSQGPAVIPGDPDASLLIRAIRYADPDLQMPPDKPLPPETIVRLEQWVRLGAPDPRDPVTPAASDDPSDPIAGRNHWAFQPLDPPPPPAVRTPWPRTPLDAFVLERLESAGLSAAPDADRRTLIRRIYFRLIGLPPTPQEIEAFLADTRSDAYPRLVDRLLASPRFGERWGRHWLDLARYADSNGLDENFLFREAWRYRNWVIAAVNDDLPFDRFLLEQLAGDLLPYDSIEQRDRQRIAAGFLVVGPKVLLGNDSMNQRMEVADEQLDTIGKAVLGQTLGCARCHDHKFDPIPTDDYYALAGILTSTQVMEERYMLGQQRVMERLAALGPEGAAADEAYEQYWRKRPELQSRHDHAQEALKLLQEDQPEQFDEFAAKHAQAIADVATDTAQPRDQRIAAQERLVAELNEALSNPTPIPPRAMIPADREEPSDEFIRLAGQFDKLGEQVPRGFLRVVSDELWELPEDSSGREDLARWLTDSERGAGRLAARVLANRIWHHLIGRGLVRTSDNFGRTGEPPTHPELLDYLAGELIASGWSVKSLVREIVLSRTFAMSSRHDEAAHALDPENKLLWRGHRQRLGPEALRDAMLAIAGQLDPAPMDSTVWYLGDQATSVGDNKNRRRTDFPCRSVYLPVIRNDLPEVFDVFDFADPHATTGSRPQTMVPTQGLFLLNDDSVMAAAAATAQRLKDDTPDATDGELVNDLFERTTAAPPTQLQRDTLLEFVQSTRQRLQAAGDENPDHNAWTMACHALLASSRFQILE